MGIPRPKDSQALSPEKGLATLIAAWERLPPDLACRIIGDGPEAGRVRSASDRLSGLRPLGRRPHAEVLSELRGARALILPSGWYEGLPMVLLEAFATARPVIGSRLGSIETLVDHGRTGLLFDQGDPADLARTIAWAHDHPDQMAEVGRQARFEYLARYTAEANYRQLIAGYRLATARSAEPAGSAARR